MAVDRLSPVPRIAQKPVDTTNKPLTLTQRRAAIRRQLEARGFAVYGRCIDIGGKQRIMRYVLPERRAA